MTDVLPSASTAGSLRMIALRRAIRATPMASTTVTAAGSPSGIAATDRATVAWNRSITFCPWTSPTTKVNAATPMMAYISHMLNRAISRVSGVERSSADWISRWIFPTSVRSPVATTIPVACP
jgi:hypothetical protein